MVEIVSGSGIDRILSKNEVQEDLATRLNRLRATDARDGRIEIRAATLARGLEAEALAQAENQGPAADLESDAATRQPRFADLVGNAETVNRALEETQGVDRLVTAGERLRHFVDEGRHGDMEWMETTLDRRQHPTAMWDEAKTAIVLGMN